MRTLPIHLDSGRRNGSNPRAMKFGIPSGGQAGDKAYYGRDHGMKCPNCAEFRTRVIDSRTLEEGTIRRRRVCVACRFRFTTYELYRPEVPEWMPDFQI